MSDDLYLNPLSSDNIPLHISSEAQILTLGRSTTCDLVIDNNFISHVHCSFFYREGDLYITDMNSTNGTFVNDAQIRGTVKLAIGDNIRIGATSFELKKLRSTDALSLSHDNTSSLLRSPELMIALQSGDIIPELKNSEFILEESLDVKTSIQNSIDEFSLEVISFYDTYVLDVQYFYQSKVYLTPYPLKDMVYFPHSSKQLLFASGKDGQWEILIPSEFSATLVTREQGIGVNVDHQESVFLDPGNIIYLSQGQFHFVLKVVKKPPVIPPVSFFTNDSILWTLQGLTALIVIALSIVISLSEVEKITSPEKVAREIDRILYKKVPQKKQQDKIAIVREKTDQKVQAASKDTVSEQKKKEIIKPMKQGGAVQVVKPDVYKPRPSATLPEKTDVKQQAPVEEKRIEQVAQTAKKETAPVVDEKALEARLAKLAELGETSDLRSMKPADEKTGQKVGSSILGSGDKDLKTVAADVGVLDSDIMKLAGSEDVAKGTRISGTLGAVKGFEDSEGKTVLLGILDPRDVQNILRQYIPKFAFCYEKELERKSSKLATTVLVNFEINPLGRAQNYSFQSDNTVFSPTALSCFTKVLAAIQFPQPKGGGTVRIRQPMNLEPR